MVEQRNQDGRFTPEHTDAEILAAVRAHEPAATSEIADEVGMTRQGADRRLRRLRDEGRVNSKKIGASLVWFAPDAESDHERAVTPSRETPDQSPPKTPDTASAEQSAESDLVDDLREYLEATDQPPKTAHGRGVVLDVFQLLRADGPMKTGDLQEEIYPDYTDHWGSARTMWNAIDRYLEDIPGIEKAGYGEWGYTGDDAVREALVEEF